MDRENIDPLVQQVTIMNGIITILRELVDFSSSESDEAEYAMHVAEYRLYNIGYINQTSINVLQLYFYELCSHFNRSNVYNTYMYSLKIIPKQIIVRVAH